MSSLKGAWSASPHEISPERLRIETSNFVRGLAMWSISLVMTDCPPSGRGQGHVSNFYILDLENFASASHRRLSAINKLIIGQHVDYAYGVERVVAECTSLVDCNPLTPLLRFVLDLYKLLRLQCFDAVGWAAGRASGLQKTEWWGAGVVVCLERGADLHMAQLMLMFTCEFLRCTQLIRSSKPSELCTAN